MSPVDSAIASGATSGVTTKAASVVAENDLETFEDEEQFQQPQSAGGFGYQGFQEQQPGSKFNSHAYPLWYMMSCWHFLYGVAKVFWCDLIVMLFL